MQYRFIDDAASFTITNPHPNALYFPLTNKKGDFLSSISPNLAGDIKADQDQFLTPPASIEDIRNSLLCRRDFFLKIASKIVRLSNLETNSLECGFLYHTVYKKDRSLKISITNFIPHEL